jgi:regulator of protease activity HflC (stomatin/prohibitin superfamily)
VEVARVDPILALLAVAIVVVVAALVVGQLRIVAVHDYERGMRYSRGRLTGLLDPGAYVAFRPISEIRVFDVRPTFVTIDGQDVLTADGVNLRISLVARYLVGDPAAAVGGDQDYRRALYLILQLALRDALAGRTADALLAARAELGASVKERSAGPIARLGVELLSVDVRDLMLPAELKRAFAGVVAARKDGEIALERARGETAALRNLANAARMLEDNPGLVQLRLLQEIGGSTGNTIVVGMPDGAIPVNGPRRARSSSSGAPPADRTTPRS